MNEEFAGSEASALGKEQPGLSQVERVVDTFVAPSMTFKDILRSAAWWLPFLLIVLISTGSTYTIDRNVGFSRVAENQIHVSPKAEAQMSELAPADRASQMEKRAIGMRYFSYGFPVLLLLFFAIYAAILLGTINFGLGAQMTYGQSFAVAMYASLPYLVISLLTILTVAFGNNAETFNIQNPVGTNLAYYMPDAAPWLRTLLMQFDLVRLWSLVLTIVGFKIVAKRSTGQIVAVVVGWWMLVLLVSVVAATVAG
ncbi:MAG TPA: YIP1 family protein [Acidobacteriaceae bacterium]|nr:YIP1 family protein [Acidobacteriaceae bacterium]